MPATLEVELRPLVLSRLWMVLPIIVWPGLPENCMIPTQPVELDAEVKLWMVLPLMALTPPNVWMPATVVAPEFKAVEFRFRIVLPLMVLDNVVLDREIPKITVEVLLVIEPKTVPPMVLPLMV